MGICLDTDKNNASQEYDDSESRVEGGPWTTGAGRWYPGLGTPPEGAFPMQNESHVQFEVPKVPVIFILGGPGSGKVTHCDNITQEKRGLTHINMTDLLQQYTIGNDDVKDFSYLSSSTVTEVLMLEMKMSPAAKAYLISGYPRNMRDVVEYSEKIKTMSGVILIAWRQSLLERQIEYGAKLGHVILSIARMELANFYQNVTPVVDFFDQRGILSAVNGERNPVEVYGDFRTAVLKILNRNATPNSNPLLNENPMPVSNNNARVQSIAATVHSPPKQGLKSQGGPKNNERLKSGGDMAKVSRMTSEPVPLHRESNSVESPMTSEPVPVHRKSGKVESRIPLVIWVVGGPGSSKSELISNVLNLYPNWTQLSLGKLLRYSADITDDDNDLNGRIRSSVSTGDFVSRDVVLDIIYAEMKKSKYMDCDGIVIDGFPREMSQLIDFESKYQIQPPMILLDCSKLQLHKGEMDNSVSAFRRRLELFRERTLPMLRAMDVEHRLTIVDGDTQILRIREEFENVLKKTIDDLESAALPQDRRKTAPLTDSTPVIHDLEREPHASLVNKHAVNHVPNGFGPPRDKEVNTISRNVPMFQEVPPRGIEREDPL